MPLEVSKTIGGANEESIQLTFDPAVLRYKIQTLKIGAGQHYALGFQIGDAEWVRFTINKEILPINDNEGSIGTAGKRWALVRAATVTPGDIIFSDKKTGEELWKIHEDADCLYIQDYRTKKDIAKFDREGNLYLQGEVKKWK